MHIKDFKSVIEIFLHDKTDINILDIGFGEGESTKVLLSLKPRMGNSFIYLRTVDIMSQHHFLKFITEIKEKYNTSNWKYIEDNSDNFFANNKSTFDIIHIDGDHSYDQVAKDLENSLRVLKTPGLCFLHDYRAKEVQWVVDDFFQEKSREYDILRLPYTDKGNDFHGIAIIHKKVRL